MPVSHLRSIWRIQEPPGGSTDSCSAYITTDGQVPEEQPAGDKRFVCFPWGFLHDVKIRRVETQSGGWETISDQVDPQQLDGNQSFWETESGCQENTEKEKIFKLLNTSKLRLSLNNRRQIVYNAINKLAVVIVVSRNREWLLEENSKYY